MAHSLSISIVTFSPPLEPAFRDVIDQLMASVKHARDAGLLDEVTLTVIDNGNNRTLLEPVLTELSGTIQSSFISNDRNVGYSAHNLAIAESESEFHLVLNPDVLLAPDALSAALEYLASHTEAVMLCPYSEGREGTPSYLCKRYPSVFDLALRGFAGSSLQNRFNHRLAHYEYRDHAIDEKIESVELVSGCCMLARSHALKACDGFDESFFLYFEDFDLSIRMKAYGRVDYFPGMKIIHYGGNAARKGAKHVLYFMQSATRFYRKHGFKVF